jgi:hypothetical protein
MPNMDVNRIRNVTGMASALLERLNFVKVLLARFVLVDVFTNRWLPK